MSYILDALNKSENERRAAAAPGLMPGASFVVAPQKRTRHGGAAFVLAGGMLVAGLALGSWRPWQAPADDEAARVVALSTAETPVVAAAVPSSAAVLPAAKVPAKAASKPAAAPASDKAKPKAVAKTAPEAKSGLAATSPAGTAGAAAPPPVVVEAAPEPRAKRVVSYRELPASVRKQLPEITYGGFAGTGEDAVNIAFINNRLVKAGEEVSPGVRLESVAQDGVVLAYQGHRFKP